MPAPTDHTIDVVRDRPLEEWSAPVLQFWAALGALTDADAQERLPQIVCVLRDQHGEVAGVNSVYPADIALIGGRRFWVYRRLLDPRVDADAVDTAFVAAAFRALEAQFDPDGDGPIGLCLLLGPRERRRQPEAEWHDPRILYAGYLPDGRQVRIGYFAGARIGRDGGRARV